VVIEFIFIVIVLSLGCLGSICYDPLVGYGPLICYNPLVGYDPLIYYNPPHDDIFKCGLVNVSGQPYST